MISISQHAQHARPAGRTLAAGLAFAAATAMAQTTTQHPARRPPAAPTQVELAQRLERLADELAEVKAQLGLIKQAQATVQAQAPVTLTTTPATAAATTAAAAAPQPAPPIEPAYSASLLGPGTVLTGYGEINYNRPTGQNQNTQVDVRRFVLGYQHRFDERTKVVTELEVEHAVSSADDPGEVEVEQAYLERQLTPHYAVRGGLFLMPAGLLNENHEPTAYYGVERNFVETAIIPSTWREGGLQVVVNDDNGLTVQGGISTGFDLNKWDATSTEGRESPLASIHQELALAKGHDLAGFAALNWRGVPGLLLGGSFFSGQATQKQAVANGRVTLWDVHGRYTPGRWDFAALYARGSIGNTAALNAPLVGNRTLIPKTFDGYYAQGAYKLWSHGDYALLPFARWERFNTAKAYADLGPGLTPKATPDERVITVGANLLVAQGVVLKADYQRFRENTELNRIDLGLGWSF